MTSKTNLLLIGALMSVVAVTAYQLGADDNVRAWRASDKAQIGHDHEQDNSAESQTKPRRVFGDVWVDQVSGEEQALLCIDSDLHAEYGNGDGHIRMTADGQNTVIKFDLGGAEPFLDYSQGTGVGLIQARAEFRDGTVWVREFTVIDTRAGGQAMMVRRSEIKEFATMIAKKAKIKVKFFLSNGDTITVPYTLYAEEMGSNKEKM